MIEQLASLLLPIDALLAHADFNPQKNASGEVVMLFRNMWFLCILFHFTSSEEKEDTAMEWQKPALARIAAKMPSIVLEEPHDSILNELEYNSVIRQEYAHSVGSSDYTGTSNIFLFAIQVVSKHRAHLTKHISLRGSEIRHLSPGQIMFLLTMHDMESMRSAAGLPSSLVFYFINSGLNGHYGLSVCMDSIAEKVC
jgi:phosphatidylinositol 4-kinase A